MLKLKKLNDDLNKSLFSDKNLKYEIEQQILKIKNKIKICNSHITNLKKEIAKSYNIYKTKKNLDKERDKLSQTLILLEKDIKSLIDNNLLKKDLKNTFDILTIYYKKEVEDRNNEITSLKESLINS